MVTTVCYKKTDVWQTREEAIDFFFEGMIATEGSAESMRYERIVVQLVMGADYATDEED